MDSEPPTMKCPEIKKLLKESIGLHAEAVGDSSIERAVRLRMGALDMVEESDYLARLKSCAQELAELIEEIVVPETWFFRNVVPFATLARLLPELLEQSQERFLRILSLPCSTGEEPYSIAMTLLECTALGGFDFIVDSVDVSQRAIDKANKAVYGNYSFREGDEIDTLREKYFDKEKNAYRLKAEVKQYVKAVRGNVLTDNIAPSACYYDVIFCRNLLIYFDRETQARVLNKLGSLLKPAGILFLGHAESSQAVNELFTRINIPKSFAYQKKAAKPISTPKSKAAANIKALEAAYQQLMKTIPAAAPTKTREKRPDKPKKPRAAVNTRNAGGQEEISSHGLIGHHIELGRLTEAAAECEKLLKAHPESAEAYYLLGLISHLEGNNGAAEALLKKAMYLDPNHHGALGLSAMLAEKRGDPEIAQTLRRREQRVLKRKSPRNNND